MAKNIRIHVVDATSILATLAASTLAEWGSEAGVVIHASRTRGTPAAGETDGVVWVPTSLSGADLSTRLGELLTCGVPLVAVDIVGSAQLQGAATLAGVPCVRGDATATEMKRVFRTTFLGQARWEAASVEPLDDDASAVAASSVAATAPGTTRPPELSAREEEVLRLYAAGLLLKQIAYETGVSVNTVKSYRARIQAKYAMSGVHLRQRLDFHVEARRRFRDLTGDLNGQPFPAA